MPQRDEPTILDWVKYLIIRTFEALIVSLPWRTGRLLAQHVGTLIWFLDRPSRKERMARDIKEAFPELTGPGVSAIIKRSYCSLAGSVLDSLQFIRIARSGRWRELTEVRGEELLEGIGGKVGMIFVTGHFGCWEVVGTVNPELGYPVASLARPRTNPLLEEHLLRVREARGQEILQNKGSMLSAIRALKSGKNLGFLIDQDARHRGIFVDFFGRPASTVTSVARLSISTGAPVVFVYGRRTGERHQFEVVFKDVIRPRQEADEQEEIFRITQRFTQDLEELVSQWPGEWLWLHRRWKTYPGKYQDQPPPRASTTVRGSQAEGKQRQMPASARGARAGQRRP